MNNIVTDILKEKPYSFYYSIYNKQELREYHDELLLKYNNIIYLNDNKFYIIYLDDNEFYSIAYHVSIGYDKKHKENVIVINNFKNNDYIFINDIKLNRRQKINKIIDNEIFN